MSGSMALAWAGVAFAFVPLAIALGNLRPGRAGFRRPDRDADAGVAVSILIPARDEERQIEAAVRHALASRGVEVEVVVLDDQSSDRTADLVQAIARQDARVRLVTARPLPAGWAGKQSACAQLAEAARHDVLMFVDADVMLSPEAATRAAGLLLEDADLGLVSGFPRERTASLAEEAVIPWIHVVLLGYLPMARMRASRAPSFAAGCGQWMVARRGAYRASGGHGASPLSRHDGLSLPRAFRRAGWRTDLFDGSAIAECRMYTSAGAVWRGFGKSAGEGMATPVAIAVWTVLLGLGHVLPWVVMVVAIATRSWSLAAVASVGVAANVALRLLLARRLKQPWMAILLHPIGAVCVLAIQWQATLRHVRGAPSAWKGRHYAGAAAARSKS